MRTQSLVGAPSLVETGIEGLDFILGGGLIQRRLYLVHGTPGAGKTTLGLRYLLEGAKLGERGLYVTLTETKEELDSVAFSHGWNLNQDAIEIYETTMTEADLTPENQYFIFEPTEVELSNVIKSILGAFERINPTRVVIDSLSEIRLLAQNSLRYRHQILALKRYFEVRGATAILLDETKSLPEDLQLESLVHGVIKLELFSPDYGADQRRLRIIKYRGAKYHGGYHDFIIVEGGLKVFPRLIAAEHKQIPSREFLKSNIKELDDLLGEGILYGTSALFIGPSGVGKSSLAMQFAIATAMQGERVAFFAFDELLFNIEERAAGLGMPLKHYMDNELITIQSINPAELSPGEFADVVRKAAEGKDNHLPARTIIIDSLNGYLNAMPGTTTLLIQLHELLAFLGYQGVVTFLVVAQHGLLGLNMKTPLDTSNIADTVFSMHNFEARGELKKAIAVVKKRHGNHASTIQEFFLDSHGIHIGKQFTQFQGIFTGIPNLTTLESLLPNEDE